MKRWIMKIGSTLLVFMCGVLVGNGVSLWSLFPTAHGNLIFSKATTTNSLPNGSASRVVVAHLALIHDMSFLHKQTWRYKLLVSDGQGKPIGEAEFKPEDVGGLFRLEHSASLIWDDDVWAVTARVGDFMYRYELPKESS
ncbi:MAG: hypothetical protein ACYSUC_07680 [Planctomycetota bacterium]|jgi:hypothetical protein